jgi:hypothetical protein
MSSVLSVLKHAVLAGKVMNWFKVGIRDGADVQFKGDLIVTPR